MSRASLLFLLSVTLAAPSLGCNKKDKGSTNPDEAAEAEGEVDPLEELKAIPTQVQAEVDLVLQPITDVDVVIDQISGAVMAVPTVTVKIGNNDLHDGGPAQRATQ